jgi:Peptidase family S41
MSEQQRWQSKQKQNPLIVLLIGSLFFTGCLAGKQTFNAQKKFTPQQLQKDYTIFKNILEQTHPGIYWFTPKDSMDFYFAQGFQKLQQPLTENEFRTVLSYVTAKIRCGHTGVKSSKKQAVFNAKNPLPTFALALKFMQNEAVITANLFTKDSLLKRGTIITAINNYPVNFLRDSLSQFISTDGYNYNHQWQNLSSRNLFTFLYSNVFTKDSVFKINYIDIATNPATTFIKSWKADATKKKDTTRLPVNFLREQQLAVDTAAHIAYIELSTFSNGNGVKKFLRKSFKSIKKFRIKHLVLDVRNNGGGNINNSNYLTRLLINHKYKIADSLYATTKTSRYGKYFKSRWQFWPLFTFSTKKRNDGKYHFGYYERHYFKPKTKNHYNQKLYIITGPNSFSATAIFARFMKGQQNVTIVGEETGGGSYGNNAWVIPDVTLPETKIRFTAPRFRLVINKNQQVTGHGVLPDVYAAPTQKSIMLGVDMKMLMVRKLIKENNPK